MSGPDVYRVVVMPPPDVDDDAIDELASVLAVRFGSDADRIGAALRRGSWSPGQFPDHESAALVATELQRLGARTTVARASDHAESARGLSAVGDEAAVAAAHGSSEEVDEDAASHSTPPRAPANAVPVASPAEPPAAQRRSGWSTVLGHLLDDEVVGEGEMSGTASSALSAQKSGSSGGSRPATQPGSSSSGGSTASAAERHGAAPDGAAPRGTRAHGPRPDSRGEEGLPVARAYESSGGIPVALSDDGATSPGAAARAPRVPASKSGREPLVAPAAGDELGTEFDRLFVPDTGKRRLRPAVAGALSLVCPGAGQVYAGSPDRGLLFALAAPLLLPWLWAIIDAFLLARRIEGGRALRRRAIAPRRVALHAVGVWAYLTVVVVAADRYPYWQLGDDVEQVAALRDGADSLDGVDSESGSAAPGEMSAATAGSGEPVPMDDASRRRVVQGLIMQARAACGSGRYDECRRLAEEALDLDEANRNVQRLHVEAISNLSGPPPERRSSSNEPTSESP